MALLSAVILRDTFANRPSDNATLTEGRLFYATDRGLLYRDNGTSWDALLDINSLTADGSPDAAADYVVTYDASAGYLKKVLLEDLPGGGGGSSGDMALIQQQVLGSDTATVTFGSGGTLTQAYKSLYLEVQGRCDQATAQFGRIQFNSDTGANYDYQTWGVANNSTGGTNQFASTALIFGEWTPTGATAGASSAYHAKILNYTNTNWWKDIVIDGMKLNSVASGGMTRNVQSGEWRNTAAITQIDITLAAGNFKQNSIFTLWGIK